MVLVSLVTYERGEFGARAVVVDAASEDIVSFYQSLGFRELDDRRLWQRACRCASARSH